MERNLNFQPTDDKIRILYQKYRLGDNPTEEQIRKKALPVLKSGKTIFEGAELVLTRTIPGKSKFGLLIRTAGILNRDPEEVSEMLLEQKVKEMRSI